MLVRRVKWDTSNRSVGNSKADNEQQQHDVISALRLESSNWTNSIRDLQLWFLIPETVSSINVSYLSNTASLASLFAETILGKEWTALSVGENLRSGWQAEAVQPGLSNTISGFKDSATELLPLFFCWKTLAAGKELLISESGEGVSRFCPNCLGSRRTHSVKSNLALQLLDQTMLLTKLSFQDELRSKTFAFHSVLDYPLNLNWPNVID